MGTSKSYKGPPGRSALLPPWAPALGDGGDVGEQAPESEPEADSNAGDDADKNPPEQVESTTRPGFQPVSPEVTWRSPNGFAGKLARSPRGGGRDRHRAVGRAFVRALGGSRQAARSAPAARSAARSLGGFLSSVARDGIAATAARFGFSDYLGGGVDALLGALVRVFAPAGADLDQAATLRAEIKTYVEMLDKFDVATLGPEALDSLDETGIRDILERFVANCVAERLLQALAGKVEAEAVTAVRAKEVEDELRDFVRANVALEFGNVSLTDLSWDSRESDALIDRLFEGGYEVLEAST